MMKPVAQMGDSNESAAFAWITSRGADGKCESALRSIGPWLVSTRFGIIESDRNQPLL